MRIALVYDCLYPNTIGGAERLYRHLGERLSERHHVTYLTRRQWGDEGPGTPFETIAVAPGWKLYTRTGRRSIGAPLRFGWGVFWHLLRHADRYDAVHTASFPYFSVLGAWAALRLRRSTAPLIVDWYELWRQEYWLSYLGPLLGRAGIAVQRLCVHCADCSFTFSRLVETRLRSLGSRATVIRLTGAYDGPDSEPGSAGEVPPDPPLVVFAGRHIAEKRIEAIPPAVAAARRKAPSLRCLILGDGPETPAVREVIAELGLEGAIEMHGRVEEEEVRRAMAAATCLLHPSAREGYGLVVVESCVLGTPVVLVAGPENAATELVEAGINGFVSASPDPDDLAEAIVTCIEGGKNLRRSTFDWYARNREVLSLSHSLDAIEAVYADLADSPLETAVSDTDTKRLG